MKTAISIPDDLFEAAERFAQTIGVSRSALYAVALREYLQHHRGEGVTERLDAIYGAEVGDLAPELAQLQARSLPRDDW